jgi:GntR family transcriptional regulator
VAAGVVNVDATAMARRANQSDGGNALDESQLHRKSFVPLYFQLAEVLKERIEAGDWPAGGRFLSERELCDQFGVSRTVVRPALTMLEDDGQLVRIKGRGTFLAPAKIEHRIRGLTRSLAEPLPDGTEIRVLEAVRQKPERQVAQDLQIEPRRDATAHVYSVTALEGEPVFLCDSFVAIERVPEILSTVEQGEIRSSAHPALSLELAHSRVRIQTSFCSEFEAHQLEVTAGALVFLIRYLEFARAGRSRKPVPVEAARVVYRADTVELDGDLL